MVPESEGCDARYYPSYIVSFNVYGYVLEMLTYISFRCLCNDLSTFTYLDTYKVNTVLYIRF